jgi:hypothetical protein
VWSSDFLSQNSNADFHTRDPSKFVATVLVSGWKKPRSLLCLLHSLRTVGVMQCLNSEAAAGRPNIAMPIT